MVRGDEHAHAADADQDANDLRVVVADMEQDEGDGHHHDNGPEVDQLGAHDIGVAVCEHNEVVAFDVEKGENDIFLR